MSKDLIRLMNDLLLFQGVEPSLNWRRFTTGIV